MKYFPGLLGGGEGDHGSGPACAKSYGALISKNKSSWAPEAHACSPNYSRGRDQEDHSSKPAPGEIVLETLSRKYPTQKKVGRVAQMGEHLPSKRETLNSTPVPPKKKEQTQPVAHAKIERIKVSGQHGQIVLETPSPKKAEQSGLEVWLKQ
jgi:hypothetical protein